MGLRSVLKKPGILFGGFLSLATLSVMNAAYTNVLDAIKSDLALTYTWTGALMSAYFIGYTLGQIPWGVLSDRNGSRLTMSLSVLGVSLSTLLFGFSETVTMAVALRFLSGLLGAGIFVPGVKLVSSWFNSDERGTALGILNIGGSTGMILASWFVPVLSADLGWNNGLKLTGGLGFVSAVLCFTLLKDNVTERRTLNIRELPVDRREFWGLSLMQFIRLGSYYTFIAWMPLVLREDYGFSIVATSAAMSLLNLAGIFANPLGGWVSDRLDERRVLSGGFIMLAALIFTLALQPVGVLLYVLVFLLGWFLNFSRSPSFTIIPRLFGTDSAGSISGINNTFASFGAFALPLLLGYIRDYTRSYQVGWMMLSALSLVASAIMYLMKVDK
ncbi:MAG: nitrate/nitrite transporter [Candidatus Bathyarchaeota archaeon]